MSVEDGVGPRTLTSTNGVEVTPPLPHQGDSRGGPVGMWNFTAFSSSKCLPPQHSVHAAYMEAVTRRPSPSQPWRRHRPTEEPVLSPTTNKGSLPSKRSTEDYLGLHPHLAVMGWPGAPPLPTSVVSRVQLKHRSPYDQELYNIIHKNVPDTIKSSSAMFITHWSYT